VTSAETPAATPQVALLADTESRWKWAARMAARLGPEPEVVGYQLWTHELPSHRQLLDAGVRPEQVRQLTPSGLLDALAVDRPDVLIVAAPGGGCQAVLQLLATAHLEPRPLVITGYLGVVYENLVDGLLLRAGSDLIAANSPADLDQFQTVLSSVGARPESLVRTTLPFLEDPAPRSPSARFALTFAGQPGVPASRAERQHVVQRLADHARRHPERDVLVKVRNLPGEVATPPEPHPYDELIRGLGTQRPANLKVIGGLLSRALSRSDLLVTVSSTAALEAIHAGVPAAVLTDFGVRESLGNTYFLGSGLLASFDELDRGLIPKVRSDWAIQRGVRGLTDELPQRVAQALTEPRGELRPFYRLDNASGFLPRLLAGYGIGPDGRPLASRTTSVLRKAVRTGARGVYRHGTTVIGPALRRLAAL
jgi:hypothetical protein